MVVVVDVTGTMRVVVEAVNSMVVCLVVVNVFVCGRVCKIVVVIFVVGVVYWVTVVVAVTVGRLAVTVRCVIPMQEQADE